MEPARAQPWQDAEELAQLFKHHSSTKEADRPQVSKTLLIKTQQHIAHKKAPTLLSRGLFFQPRIFLALLKSISNARHSKMSNRFQEKAKEAITKALEESLTTIL